MSLLSNLFKKKKKVIEPELKTPSSAIVEEVEERNISYTGNQVQKLPLGLTPTTYFSKRSKWNPLGSRFISGSRYNAPKNPLDKAAVKRRALTNV